MEKKLTIKGHKLVTRWSGAQDSYANGRCQCGGWHFRGWTTSMRSVRISHQGHLKRIAEGNPIPEFDLPNNISPQTMR